MMNKLTQQHLTSIKNNLSVCLKGVYQDAKLFSDGNGESFDVERFNDGSHWIKAGYNGFSVNMWFNIESDYISVEHTLLYGYGVNIKEMCFSLKYGKAGANLSDAVGTISSLIAHKYSEYIKTLPKFKGEEDILNHYTIVYGDVTNLDSVNSSVTVNGSVKGSFNI